MAEIFGVDRANCERAHLNFLSGGELDVATIRKFRIVRQEGGQGGRARNFDHYGLDVAFYVGYRVNSARGVLFRRWATQILIQYATKGFVVDAQRLKEPDNFDRIRELKEIIQDIRGTEANVYAELRRICSLCQDYDPKSPAAIEFYKRTQAKLFYAVTSNTPSMILAERAVSSEPNMGLQTWSKVEITQKDALVAKNYLTETEIRELNRLTAILLDVFDDQLAIGKLTLMSEAAELLDSQLKQLNRAVLNHGGKVSSPVAEDRAKEAYARFDEMRRAERKERAQAELAELKSVDKSLPKTRRKSTPPLK